MLLENAKKGLIPAHPVKPAQPGLLQRKCECGGSAGFVGECSQCQSERLRAKPLQTKLSINVPGDQYEQEADRVAEQVTGISNSLGGLHKSHTTSAPMVRRQATENTAAMAEVPPIVHEELRSPGQPLDSDTRAFFEPRFGHDLSNVRVHTDMRAAESAQLVNALAYTTGWKVVFGAGQYAPGTMAGRKLIAHELTHVLQQRQGLRAGSFGKIKEQSYAELEADRLADQIVAGQDLPWSMGKADSAVQLQAAGADSAAVARHIANINVNLNSPQNVALEWSDGTQTTGIECSTGIGRCCPRPCDP
ncbi:MAG: DUF4157 domain-containing protein, partial [Deltaproteobacteria bacterium]|nr:DUF4157 domain-containing protein [Deltaproteobacteria bacterium]